MFDDLSREFVHCCRRNENQKYMNKLLNTKGFTKNYSTCTKNEAPFQTGEISPFDEQMTAFHEQKPSIAHSANGVSTLSTSKMFLFLLLSKY